ncbi:MAG: hypothetical protein H8K05_20970 [Nitrospira sp.]|nr:hypothetical protein [Nitrospira sp.]
MIDDDKNPGQSVDLPSEIPELKRFNIYCSEGCTDYELYARPIGTRRSVMIFVEFPDAPAGSVSAADTANHLLGNGLAQQLFKDQSYGKFELAVTVRDDLGWRKIPNASLTYDCHDFNSHRQYVADASQLFSREIDFSEYDFVFIVAPYGASFLDSPAFNAPKGQGALSPSGEIRLAVTFGKVSYRNNYVNLVHEVSHLIGLPDLYPYGESVNTSKAGCWDLMSDIFHCECYLGWHRYKNGWFDPTRISYLWTTTTDWPTTLSPIQCREGLSMVILPIDDMHSPSKVLCIELSQTRTGKSNEHRPEGVLIYTVDSSVPTGHSPLHILPKRVSQSAELGYLYEACFQPNDSKAIVEGTTNIEVLVVERLDSRYRIQVSYHR